jgi:nitroreductase
MKVPTAPTGTPAEPAFPGDAGPRQKLAFLLRYAVLAPSSHNSQPWLFRLGERSVELHADRSRALPVVDPDDRELVLSCGAALFTLTVAMRRHGLVPSVELLPVPEEPDLLARVTIAGAGPPEAHELFAAIPLRHTVRERFEERAVSPQIVDELGAAAAAQEATLALVTGGAREILADLVSDGDRVQAADKSFRRELAAWMRPNATRRRDGIPGYSVGLPSVVSYVGPFVLRTFDWGRGQAARDHQLAAGSPILAVVATDTDGPRDWLVAGQALQHVLLTARARGLATSFLNQPIEVAELRPRLAALIGGGAPQLVLRIGFGGEGIATPRREVEDVLLD